MSSYKSLLNIVSVDADEITSTSLNVDTLTVNNSLTITGATLEMDQVDNSSIQFSSNVLSVKDSGITTAKINPLAVTDAKINDVGANKITGYINSNQISTGIISNTEFNHLDGLDQDLTTTSGVQFASLTNTLIVVNDTDFYVTSQLNYPSGFYFNGDNLSSFQTYYAPDASGELTINEATQTLTNKVIDVTQNTLINISNVHISPTANIDVSKLGTGAIDNTEFNYLNGLNQTLTTTSNVQFGAITCTTLNTGLGAYELYAMNQNVRSTDSPTFSYVTFVDGIKNFNGYIMLLPASADTLVGRSSTDTLTNKTLTSPIISTIVNTGTLTLPTSTDTLIGRNTTDTLTNKTLSSPIISTISNTGTLTLPTSTDTLIGRNTTDTLTNKTLTSPIISTIVNTGTLSLPTSTDTLVGRATTDTLTNKTLTSPIISTIVNTGTLTLPISTDTLVGRATTDTLTNKSISGSTNTITNISNSSLSSGIDATKIGDGSVSNATYGLLSSATSQIYGASDVETFLNKSIIDTWNYFVCNSDTTKKLQFALSGITTGTTRTLTVPNASTTIVGTDTTQTLTNKTLTSPIISTISNTGTLTLPTSTDTLVGKATTDTLTNKTLTSPIISTISNTGTLTLPTSTDTLVGRATTDTLTNKTITASTNTLKNDYCCSMSTQSSFQSISASTTTQITFSTSDYDPNSMVDLANEKITVPVNGYYSVTLFVYWASGTTGYRDVYIYVNGTLNRVNRDFGATSATYTTITANLKLTSTDYLTFYCYHTNASSITIGASSGQHTYVRATTHFLGGY